MLFQERKSPFLLRVRSWLEADTALPWAKSHVLQKQILPKLLRCDQLSVEPFGQITTQFPPFIPAQAEDKCKPAWKSTI